MAANNHKIKFVFFMVTPVNNILLSRKLLSTQFVYAGNVP